MAKHAVIAYALWLVGSWVGLHHIYLNRPRAAFLHAASFNCWGVGWLRDLLSIPQYVVEANAYEGSDAAREYAEALRVQLKYHKRPPFQLLATIIQGYVGAAFGVIGSSLLPAGLPGFVYELLFIVGGGFGIKFSAEALDLRTVASFRVIAAAIAVVVVPAYVYFGFDHDHSDYRSSKSASIILGTITHVLTRSWSPECLMIEATDAKRDLPKPRNQPSLIKTLLKYWAMLALFFTCACTALLFHGQVTVVVDGVSRKQPFFEAANNVIQSDAFQNLYQTLSDLYKGKSYEERFEERWKRFNVEIDVSGKFRYLKVLGLPRNATESDIKAAYRRLVLQWHPDKYTGEDHEHANQMFYKIQEAYEKLTQPDSKKKTPRRPRASDSDEL